MTETDRRSTKDLLAQVLEVLPVGLGLFEVEADDMRLLFTNQEFQRALDLPQQATAGRSGADTFRGAERDPVLEAMRLATVTGEVQNVFAAAGRAPNGPSRVWNVDVYPVGAAGSVMHVLAIVRETWEDLDSRRRQAEEASRLREQATQLAANERAKSEFLNLASHELRGPAAVLRGYLAMLRDGSLGAVPDSLARVLPLLWSKANQINMLANEMVEAARLEDGRLQLRPRRLDLRELVRRTVGGTRDAAPGRRILLHETVSGPVEVMGDTMRLEIIVQNLVDNALKYSAEGADVEVTLSTGDGQASLRVRDWGIGILPEDLPRLFVRFSRLGTRPEVPGTGLGLYLARELARLHGGDIEAVSSPGEGSAFSFRLPLAPPAI